jgi:hypothetical protein
MRLTSRKPLLACAAALAIGVASAGAAQAAVPTWHSGGKVLSGTLKTKATFGVTHLWNLLGTVIVCQRGSVQGGTITQGTGAGTGAASGLTYEECKLYNQVEESGKRQVGSELTACSTTGINTVAVSYKLVYVPLHEPENPNKLPVEIAERFEPEGGTLTKLKLNGASCPVKGSYEIRGGATGKFAQINTEAKTGSLAFEGEGTLMFGGTKLTLETTQTLELESDALFGVHQ